jgi:hypothetical protein
MTDTRAGRSIAMGVVSVGAGLVSSAMFGLLLVIARWEPDYRLGLALIVASIGLWSFPLALLPSTQMAGSRTVMLVRTFVHYAFYVWLIGLFLLAFDFFFAWLCDTEPLVWHLFP